MFRNTFAGAAVSRRSFLRFAGAAVPALTLPILTEAHFARAAGIGFAAFDTEPLPPPGAVLINANENPLGPSAEACEAIARIAHKGGRYDIDDETGKLTATFARQNGLKPEYVAVYAGSSEPLHYSVLAWTSPSRSYVTADPSYEAGMVAAEMARARVIKVPLTADHAHDVKAMLAADRNAGLIYICNPNNPTGTLPRVRRSSMRSRTSRRVRSCW